MAGQSRFLQFLAIFLFAGAIVALGAQELHRRFAAQSGRAVMEGKEIVKYLHGEVDMEKASASRRKEQDQAAAAKDTSGQSKESWLDGIKRRMLP